MSRSVYGASPLLGSQQCNALWRAWMRIAFDARDNEHGVLRRLYAETARELLAAFGQRIDGRGQSPFPFHLPNRLRCEKCKRSTATRIILHVRPVRKDGQDEGTAWYCVDCLNREREYARQSWSWLERIEIIGAEPEATCAA